MPTPPYEPAPTPPAVPAPTDDALSANSTLNDTVGVFKRTYFSTDLFRDAKFVETFGLTVRAAQNWKMPPTRWTCKRSARTTTRRTRTARSRARGANGTIPCARRAVLAGADGFELHFFESFVTPEGETRAGDWVDSWSALHAAPATTTTIGTCSRCRQSPSTRRRSCRSCSGSTTTPCRSARSSTSGRGPTAACTQRSSTCRSRASRSRSRPSSRSRATRARASATLRRASARRACGCARARRARRAARRARRGRAQRAGLPGVVVAALATFAPPTTPSRARYATTSKVLGVDLGTHRRRQAPHRGRQAQSGGRRRQRRRRRRERRRGGARAAWNASADARG